MSLSPDNTITVKQKVSEFTKQYLLDTLEQDFYASDFSQKDFDALLDMIASEYGEEKTQASVNMICTGIGEHFRRYNQECEVSISDSSIEISNKLNNGVETVEMDRAKLGLDVALTDLFKKREEYTLRDKILCFPQEVVDVLYQKFSDTELSGNEQAIRNVVRGSVEDCFELEKNDIILFLEKRLYIRYFIDARVAQDGANKRFLGISAEKMEKIYNKNFPEDFGKRLLGTAPDVINDILNFGEIHNLTFKAKYIDTFRTLVDVVMSEYSNGIEDENMMAMNGYILRQHFDTLLYLCAKILVAKVMQRDKKADEFLHFYNGESFTLANGKSIKKPSIVDTDGVVWDFNSIFSNISQSIQQKKKFTKQYAILNEIKDKHQKAIALIAEDEENSRQCTKELRVIRLELDKCTALKNELLSISNPNREESARLQEKSQAEKLLLEKKTNYSRRDDQLRARLKNIEVIEKRRMKQLEIAKTSLLSTKKHGDILKKQKKNMLTALSKALIFR